MSDLAEMVTWLRAQVMADKASAEAAETREGWKIEEKPDGDSVFEEIPFFQVVGDEFPWQESARSLLPGDAAHIACHDPRDVIADCDAKLAIIELHERDVIHGTDVLYLLAMAYWHRDGWKDAWRP